MTYLHRLQARGAQRGLALVIVLVMVGMAVTALVYGFTATTASVRAQERRTAAALAQAREALLGRATADSNRPGSLPCPDADNDGDADTFIGTQCPAYIGRLPWRTLGLPDLRDGAGERLWYALSSNFRDHSSAGVLNSDTPGQLSVQDSTGVVLDNSVVAVVLAPGSTVGTQRRGSPDVLNVAMYLEGENANGDAVYFSALSSDSFNDRLVYLSREAVFAPVAVRVAREVRNALEQYRNSNGYYPAANPYSAGGPDYLCDPLAFEGRVPLTINTSSPPAGCTAQTAWDGELPSWYRTNNWNLLTHYAVASVCTRSGGAAKGMCDLAAYDPTGLLYPGSQPLTVSAVSTNVRMLVMVSGPARGGQAHPCGGSSQCLEDAANTDGNNAYVKPSRFPASNDRMALTCSTVSPCAVVP